MKKVLGILVLCTALLPAYASGASKPPQCDASIATFQVGETIYLDILKKPRGITKLIFRVNGENVATSTAFPCTFTYTAKKPGTCHLAVVAYTVKKNTVQVERRIVHIVPKSGY